MFHRHLPRPPRRRCSEGSAAAGIGDPDPNRVPARPRSTDGGNASAIRTRPYYYRRCKRSIPTNIEFLPDELLLEILLRLSAQDVFEKARLVCRRWNRIVHGFDFVGSHLQRTSSGLLLSLNGADLIFLSATKEGGVEVSNVGYTIRFSNITSCNGLVVCVESSNKHFPYIVNPATNSSFVLPYLGHRVWLGFFGIAYAAASMEYKVVATYRPKLDSDLTECVIFSAGVDKTWRRVATDGISPRAHVLLRTPKITTPGFLHWVSDRCDVVTLNVETEVLTETPVPLSPENYQDGMSLFFYLSTGKYLTLLVFCGSGSNYLWDFWEMKPETGEWRKLPRCIDLEAHKHRIHQFAWKDQYIIHPAGWVKYPEVLAFFFRGMGRSCIIYNLDRDEIDCIELPNPARHYRYVVHRNSLVWSS